MCHSCGESDSKVVRVRGKFARPAYCQACFDRMVQAVRKTYDQLLQQTIDEGILVCWPKTELIKAKEALKVAEHKELMVLFQMAWGE